MKAYHNDQQIKEQLEPIPDFTLQEQMLRSGWKYQPDMDMYIKWLMLGARELGFEFNKHIEATVELLKENCDE